MAAAPGRPRSSAARYETIYGVGLLDDLHNYFPALLYDHSRFSNLTSVFHYVRSQMNQRFNLYSYGAQMYREDSAPAPTSAPFVFVPPTPRMATAGAPAGPPTPIQTTTVRQRFEDPPTPVPGGQEDLTTVVSNLNATRVLLDLLGLGTLAAAPMPDLNDPFPPLRRQTAAPGADLWGPLRGNPFGDQFRAPVVVRPSQAVIGRNTELVAGNTLPSNTVCTVCQEAISETDQARRLIPCAHVYHRACIDQWFARSVFCPTCRHDIREAPVAPAAEPSTTPLE
jgi:hypothetical protein